jgi:hypothetical protein
MSSSTFSDISDVTIGTSASLKSVYTDSGNYVFELVGLDVSLNLDVSASYEDEIIQQGLPDVSAVATIDISASDFSDVFKITIDSSDIDDLSANDVIYDVSDATFPSISYSSATVTSGKVNSTYTDQSLKKDLVRSIAKAITGGYAASDIFSNESLLLADVVDHDASFSEAFSTILADVSSSTYPAVTDILSTAKNLLAVTLGVESRRNTLFADISNATQSGGSITVPLAFVAGDKLVVRIKYDPANDHPNSTNVTSRTYKVVLNLN